MKLSKYFYLFQFKLIHKKISFSKNNQNFRTQYQPVTLITIQLLSLIIYILLFQIFTQIIQINRQILKTSQEINHMTQLIYGNNLISLNQSQKSIKKQNQWLLVQPNTVVLQGILLTSNLNIENVHEHLAVKFIIKSYLNYQQVPFLEIFPEKGTIMRGEIKKIRIKFLKNHEKLLTDKNAKLTLKVFMNLNTYYNKQYMQMNRFSGWNEIAEMPIEQYVIPIVIGSEYKDIKTSIREQVKFESQFGKISQEMSSLFGEQKFQLPEPVINSKNNLVFTKTAQKFSQLRPPSSKGSVSGGSQKKYSQKKIESDSSKNVFFGMQPKVSNNRIKLSNQKRQEQNNRSRSFNQETKRRHNLGESQKQNDDIILPQVNQKSSKLNIKTPQRQQPFHQYSSVSLLKQIESKSSINISDRKNTYRRQQTSQLGDNVQFNTVHSLHGQGKNIRSIQLILLAIIAGFFVALGSNLKRLLY